MNALIDAISNALEFLHSWIAKGFSFAHSEWWSKLLDQTSGFAKKITWFYALLLVALAQFTTVGQLANGLFAMIGFDMTDLALNARTAMPVVDRTLDIGSATYGFMNYLLPVGKLFTLLGFFIGAKLTVSAVRFGVAVYQLLPFKFS